MKTIKLFVIVFTLLSLSCQNSKSEHRNNDTKNENTTELAQNSSSKKGDAKAICSQFCEDFPDQLVLQYHPSAKKIAKEKTSYGSCILKLFYGDKDYEFWSGELSVWANQQKDPFWQYNPERNATLFQEVKGIGDRAIFISNMNQLLILKDGLMYGIVPPNNGRATETGKENKAIAIELAQHFEL